MTEPNPLRLTIGKTRRVTGHEVPDNLADLEPADILHHVTDYVVLVDTNAPPMTHTPLPWTAKNALFESFVIDVSVDGKSLFIVDAFPLLHHTLAPLRRLPGSPTFDMDVGEGLGIDGRKAEPAMRCARLAHHRSAPQVGQRNEFGHGVGLGRTAADENRGVFCFGKNLRSLLQRA